METDIIVAGFKESWKMHRVRYMWLIGDGDSSVYHAVQLEVTSYGRDVEKVECTNHAVKCSHNQMKSLCNSHPEYRGRFGLSQTRMKRITHGARCAIVPLVMLMLFVVI